MINTEYKGTKGTKGTIQVIVNSLMILILITASIPPSMALGGDQEKIKIQEARAVVGDNKAEVTVTYTEQRELSDDEWRKKVEECAGPEPECEGIICELEKVDWEMRKAECEGKIPRTITETFHKTFVFDTTDRDMIISEIARRLGVSEEEIKQSIEFKTLDEEFEEVDELLKEVERSIESEEEVTVEKLDEAEKLLETALKVALEVKTREKIIEKSWEIWELKRKLSRSEKIMMEAAENAEKAAKLAEEEVMKKYEKMGWDEVLDKLEVPEEERKAMIEAGKKQSDDIVEQATKRSNEIIGQATKQSDEIMEKAAKQVDEILEAGTKGSVEEMENAMKQADEIWKKACKQADETLKKAAKQSDEIMEAALKKAGRAVEEAMERGAKEAIEKAMKRASKKAVIEASEGAAERALKHLKTSAKAGSKAAKVALNWLMVGEIAAGVFAETEFYQKNVAEPVGEGIYNGMSSIGLSDNFIDKSLGVAETACKVVTLDIIFDPLFDWIFGKEKK